MLIFNIQQLGESVLVIYQNVCRHRLPVDRAEPSISTPTTTISYHYTDRFMGARTARLATVTVGMVSTAQRTAKFDEGRRHGEI
jgi:hypothetical protein